MKEVKNFASKHTTISHLLSQCYALRWQMTVLFVGINVAAVGFLGTLFKDKDPTSKKLFVVTLVASLTIFGFNYLWYKVVLRANQWVKEYTLILAKLEETEGEKEGFKIFSDPNFFWHDRTTVPRDDWEKLKPVDGIRFTDATFNLIRMTQTIWAIAAIISLLILGDIEVG